MKKLFLKIIRLLFPENKMNDPKQELEKARRIIEIINGNTYKATWYSELYERVALTKDDEEEYKEREIGKAFGISFEAEGLLRCSEALLDILVVVLIRIVDGEGDNTASFQTLLEILKKPGVFQLLEQENVEHDRKLPCGLRELEKKVNAIKSDPRYPKIKSYRHAWVAHQAIELKPKKHKLPDYEDPCEWLKRLRPAVVLCRDLLRDPSSNEPDYGEQMDAEVWNAKKTANEFWEYAAHIRENLAGRED